MIETERLVVRSWRASDTKIYQRMAQDIGYNAFSPPGHLLAKDAADLAAKIQHRVDLFENHGLGKFILESRANGEFIGTCGIDPFTYNETHAVELGYRICLDHWGKGYATEAAKAILDYCLQTLNLATVFAFALPQNVASLRVIEKLGFQFLELAPHAGLPHRLYSIDHAQRINQPLARIRALHHGQVSIPVGGENTVRDFYCHFLGLQEVEKPDVLKARGGLWIQLGDKQVHFGCEDGIDRRATRSHLAYLVTNLSTWRRRLEERKIEVLDGAPIPGYERFEFRDPFGNRVEFLERV